MLTGIPGTIPTTAKVLRLHYSTLSVLSLLCSWMWHIRSCVGIASAVIHCVATASTICPQGLRIDYVLVSRGLLPHITSCEILLDLPPKWSDHAPLLLEIDLQQQQEQQVQQPEQQERQPQQQEKQPLEPKQPEQQQQQQQEEEDEKQPKVLRKLPEQQQQQGKQPSEPKQQQQQQGKAQSSPAAMPQCAMWQQLLRRFQDPSQRSIAAMFGKKAGASGGPVAMGSKSTKRPAPVAAASAPPLTAPAGAASGVGAAAAGVGAGTSTQGHATLAGSVAAATAPAAAAVDGGGGNVRKKAQGSRVGDEELVGCDAGPVKGQEEKVRDDGPPMKKRRRGEAEGQQGVEMEGGAGGVGRGGGDGVKEEQQQHAQREELQQHAQREELQLEKTGGDEARQPMQQEQQQSLVRYKQQQEDKGAYQGLRRQGASSQDQLAPLEQGTHLGAQHGEQGHLVSSWPQRGEQGQQQVQQEDTGQGDAAAANCKTYCHGVAGEGKEETVEKGAGAAETSTGAGSSNRGSSRTRGGGRGAQKGRGKSGVKPTGAGVDGDKKKQGHQTKLLSFFGPSSTRKGGA